MKIKLDSALRHKISTIKSRVIEPVKFEKWRTFLYLWTVTVCLFWMPVKFIYFMGMDYKPTFFLCGISMMGFYLLTSMIQPGSKSFWLIFLNFLITGPLIIHYFPFEELLNRFEFFNAVFGLIPLWIPIAYMVFLTWKNIQLKMRHKNQIEENADKVKDLKIKIVNKNH